MGNIKGRLKFQTAFAFVSNPFLTITPLYGDNV